MSISNRVLHPSENNDSRTRSNTSVPSSCHHQHLKTTRTKFLLFIKMLFRLLQKSGDELLLEQAKLVVVQCRCNASPQFLERIVEKELHTLVGDELFAKANQLMIHFERRQRQQREQTAPMKAKASRLQSNVRRGTSPPAFFLLNGMFHDEALLAQLEPSPIVEEI